MHLLHDAVLNAWQQFQYACLVYCIALVIESLIPAQPAQPLRHVAFNILYAFVFLFMANLLSPLFDPVVRPLINLLRIGMPIAFADTFSGQLLQVLVFYFVFDFFYYWLHRAQHTFPWLWAQHKIHHSDESLNVTTANRHHWLEVPFQGLAIWVPLGIFFQQKPVTLGWLWGLFLLWGYFIHMNIRFPLGPLTRVINGPQLHRIHHSTRDEHLDKNFASSFPVFDVLFGTYCAPRKGEYPATGLTDREDLNGVLRASWAPFAFWYRDVGRRLGMRRQRGTDAH
ncbi:MAG: sterol desaturase family protein [Dokdonella sp.]|uniref:sterol desaturase family protein n=1 Tax=Dokdonella sp. TaxID=2291710 RepID=UPI0032653C27